MGILYPPIVDTYIPAFVDNCKINFTIPVLNSLQEMYEAMIAVSIVDQKTNQSIFAKGVLLCSFDPKTNIIQIPSDFLSAVQINRYYKVQLKFISANISKDLMKSNTTHEPESSDWIVRASTYCSEWSTVCLIKRISLPNLQINDWLSGALIDPSDSLTWEDRNGIFTGKLFFEDKNETETLKSFRIIVKHEDNVVIDSGIQYTGGNSDPNSFNYISNYFFQDGEKYFFQIKCTTQNNYVFTRSNTFIVKYNDDIGIVLPSETEVIAETDEENGRIKVSILNTQEGFLGNFVIRRTSNKSDYTYWEDVFVTLYNDPVSLKYIWYDYTVENGVIYKYCVQGIKEIEDVLVRGAPLESDLCLAYFESTFLISDGVQLNIKYNSQVSSLSKVVQETKIETIGSKYPFIRKNGRVGYREFSLSGLITLHMDTIEKPFSVKDSLQRENSEVSGNEEKPLFTTKEDLYNYSKRDEIRKKEKDLFDNYQIDKNINDYNDTIYEKKFRDKVLDFLQNNQVKLFKSATEGNILVKLMQVNLTPETTLGRYLYNFSCIATEIEEYSITNCDTFNIQSIGKYEKYVFQSERRNFFGQYNKTSKEDISLDTIVAKKYKNKVNDFSIQNNFKYFNYLQIIFEDKPKKYYIKGQPFIGYLLYLDQKPFYVNSSGFLELSGEDIKINSVRILAAEKNVLINYNAVFETGENTQKHLLGNLSYHIALGQINGVFKYEDTLKKHLQRKYYFDNGKNYQNLNAIHSLTIEALPGTVFYINDFKDIDEAKTKYYNRHIVGSTGILSFYDETIDINIQKSIINNFYFSGLHFIKLSPSQINKAPFVNGFIDYQEIEKDKVFTSVDEINNPVANMVYKTNDNKRHIYYNLNWYEIDDNNDIQIDTEAIITYLFVKEKGVYK